MSIEQELRKQLTDAMKIMERRTAKGFSGEVDDAMVLEVIGAYKKQMLKAREEFAAIGEKGAEQVTELDWEIAFCERFLPKGLSDDALRAAVRAAIAATGAKDPKMAGRIVGEVMKQHKGLVEAGDVKRVAEEELAKG
jgi:uncharacterized protein YqeY